MRFDLYLRKGTVFVPTQGLVTKGLYRDIDPVDVVQATDTDGVGRALHASVARGNPPTPPYPRGTYPRPVVLKYAGLKSWHAFARGTQPWAILEKDGNYQIAGHRMDPNGWVIDPDKTIDFPAGTSINEVIERMVEIVQDAAREASAAS